MASSTSTRKNKRQSKPAAPEPKGSVLDRFRDTLVHRSGVYDRLANVANLATVMIGEVLGGMYDAVDDDLPKLKDDASKTEMKARRDKIRQTVLDYVLQHTGHYYTWSTVAAWLDAAKVNATLPEGIRVTIDDNDPDAIPSGTFGVWPLRALGRIEDEAERATLAERLAKAGQTTQTAVEDAVREHKGEKPEPQKPVAASAMTETLVASFKKREAATLAKVQHIMLTVSDDDALALADFGRLLWTHTKSDTGETDPDKRKRKRLQVFRAAAEELVYSGPTADDDDGAEDGSEPVL